MSNQPLKANDNKPMPPIQSGVVIDEIPNVKREMRLAMKNKDMALASGYGAILADLETLRDKGVERFMVFANGMIEGIAS